MIDANTVRLDQGEPDRPSEGLQTVHEGQSVMHLKFGVGVVVKHAFEPAVGLTVARIRFDGEQGERSIALGNGALRATA